MFENYGPWALIVGGSEGIGTAFADELAAAGLNLLLVARTRETLENAAADLRSRHPGREVRTLAADMSQTSGADRVLEAARGLEIGLMIYNAGACSERRDFVDMPLDFNLGLATLNVINKLRLSHAFGGPMRERGRGGIMLVGSSSYAVGNPGFATYSGVKAFSTLFSEGLWHEMRPHGVHVLGYVVTFTATPAIARTFPEMAGLGADPVDVARYGLAQMPNGPVAFGPGAEAKVRGFQAMARDKAVEQVFEATATYRPRSA